MDTLTKRETIIWTGIHRGVRYEINNYKRGNNDCWTFYLIIYLSRIPLENKPNRLWLKGKKNGSMIIYNYYKNSLISNLAWHCGCTWYSKEAGFDGEQKVIKIGCDYQHYWDKGHYYYLETVCKDVENCIDSFLIAVPDYKYWCQGNGNLYSLKDGEYKNGVFRSFEYLKRKEESMRTT
jgi:hypothetical protein